LILTTPRSVGTFIFLGWALDGFRWYGGVPHHSHPSRMGRLSRRCRRDREGAPAHDPDLFHPPQRLSRSERTVTEGDSALATLKGTFLMGMNDISFGPASANGLEIAAAWILVALLLYGGALLLFDWLHDRPWWPFSTSDADCKFYAGVTTFLFLLALVFGPSFH
jgi:hypothetical protein